MKNSKKLIGAVAALVIALAVSVGSTFAWFTTNDTVTVNGIQATVTTGESNLEIARLDEGVVVGNFSYGLTLTEDLFDGVDLKALTGGTTNGATLTHKAGVTTPAVTKNTDYIELYFRVRTTKTSDTSTAPQIVLGAASSVTSTKGDVDEAVMAWENIGVNNYGAHKKFDEGTAIEAEAANAIRIGFFDVVNASGSTTCGDAKGVWEPNANKGFFGRHDFGEDKYQAKLAEAWELYQDSLKGGTNAAAIKAAYTDPGYTEFVADGGEKAASVLTMSEGTSDLAGYWYVDFGIKIWIEGTDGDCFNNIFDHNIQISLVFQTKKA